jgi:hypothetical protein
MVVEELLDYFDGFTTEFVGVFLLGGYEFEGLPIGEHLVEDFLVAEFFRGGVGDFFESVFVLNSVKLQVMLKIFFTFQCTLTIKNIFNQLDMTFLNTFGAKSTNNWQSWLELLNLNFYFFS